MKPLVVYRNEIIEDCDPGMYYGYIRQAHGMMRIAKEKPEWGEKEQQHFTCSEKYYLVASAHYTCSTEDREEIAKVLFRVKVI